MPTQKAWLDPDAVTHLVRAAQHREPGALDRLLSTLRPWFVTRFAGPLEPDVAEDVAQSTLLRIASGLDRIEADRGAQFVVTVALNRLRSECRYEAREAQRLAPTEHAPALEASGGPDEEVEHRDLVRATTRAIRALPADLREAMTGLLRGLSPKEIAAERGLNPRTVRTRLWRARKRLRPQLACYTSVPLLREDTGAITPRRVREELWGYPLWLELVSPAEVQSAPIDGFVPRGWVWVTVAGTPSYSIATGLVAEGDALFGNRPSPRARTLRGMARYSP